MLTPSEIIWNQDLSAGLNLPKAAFWDLFLAQVQRDWQRAGMPEVTFGFKTPKDQLFYERCLVDCLEQNPELFFRYLYIVDIDERWIKAWTRGEMKSAAELLAKVVLRTAQKVRFRIEYSS